MPHAIMRTTAKPSSDADGSFKPCTAVVVLRTTRLQCNAAFDLVYMVTSLSRVLHCVLVHAPTGLLPID